MERGGPYAPPALRECYPGLAAPPEKPGGGLPMARARSHVLKLPLRSEINSPASFLRYMSDERTRHGLTLIFRPGWISRRPLALMEALPSIGAKRTRLRSPARPEDDALRITCRFRTGKR